MLATTGMTMMIAKLLPTKTVRSGMRARQVRGRRKAKEAAYPHSTPTGTERITNNTRDSTAPSS